MRKVMKLDFNYILFSSVPGSGLELTLVKRLSLNSISFRNPSGLNSAIRLLI